MVRKLAVVGCSLALVLANPVAAADLCGTWRGTSTFAGFKARKDMEVLPYTIVVTGCDRGQLRVLVHGTNSDGQAASGYAKEARAEATAISYNTANPTSGLTTQITLRLERIDGKDWLLGAADVHSVRGPSRREYRLERVPQ